MNRHPDWISFWNEPHPIYANARHFDAHYRLLGAMIAAETGEARDAVVLDFGCGEALHAPQVADHAARLVLCDAAPHVRATLAERYRDLPKIGVLSPEEVEALPAGTFDRIVMVSVAQYVAADALDGLLAEFRRLLKPDGRLVLADVIPPSVSPVTDATALLRFGWQNGFLGAALLGLARTALSDYRRLRATLGLTTYDETAMIAKLNAAGFTAQRAANNIGHNQARMTFIASPR